MIQMLLQIKWNSISLNALDRTKWVIFDTLAATWNGLNNEENKRLLQARSHGQKEEHHSIPIIGTNRFASPSNAATRNSNGQQ